MGPQLRLRRLLSAWSPDLVVHHSTWLKLVAAPALLGYRQALFVHNQVDPHHRLDRLMARFPPDALLTNSEFTAGSVSALVPRPPPLVAGCPVEDRIPKEPEVRRAVRQELGVERWVLLSHSFGGTLALEYAARHPGRVAGLVVVSGFSDAESTFATWKRELERLHPERMTAPASASGDTSDYAQVMRALRGMDAQRFFHQLQFRSPMYQQLQEAVDAESGLRNTGELSRTLFATELLNYRFSAAARVTAPVLVIGGKYDHSIGVESMRALAQSLPHAT